MHTGKNEDQQELPPIAELIKTRPNSVWGRPLTWLTPEEPPTAVFVQKFLLPWDQRAAYLYGAKHDLSQVVVAGRSDGPGFFKEFFVVTGEPGKWTTHRLRQRGSVTYTEGDEKNDYIEATYIQAYVEAYMEADGVPVPMWKTEVAEWPILMGRPMTFVGQVTLPDTEEMRALLTWDDTVFLFWNVVDERDCFKIVTYDLTLQTAEEHYRMEEEAWAAQQTAK